MTTDLAPLLRHVPPDAWARVSATEDERIVHVALRYFDLPEPIQEQIARTWQRSGRHRVTSAEGRHEVDELELVIDVVEAVTT